MREYSEGLFHTLTRHVRRPESTKGECTEGDLVALATEVFKQRATIFINVEPSRRDQRLKAVLERDSHIHNVNSTVPLFQHHEVRPQITIHPRHVLVNSNLGPWAPSLLVAQGRHYASHSSQHNDILSPDLACHTI